MNKLKLGTIGLLLLVFSQGVLSADLHPRVKLTTTAGPIVIELFPDKAPFSAADFVRYVEKGLFDGEGFYRVVRPDNDHGQPVINVIQGGLLDDKEGLAPVVHESTQTSGIKHQRGVVSLARLEVGTGSAAYFFIVVEDAPALDFGGTRNSDRQGFAAFGRVVEGMNVVDRIHQLPAELMTGEDYMQGQILKEPIKILKATIIEPVRIKPTQNESIQIQSQQAQIQSIPIEQQTNDL